MLKPHPAAAASKQNEYQLEAFREKIFTRGAKGLIGLKKQFKIMDSNGNGTLDIQEFYKACKDFRIK